MFDTVLVANRGEIAVRIMRTLRAMGIRSVAVYSDADTDALHVRTADVARRLGPAAPSQSYLDIERVIAAAVATGAQALHPGYGFLSENTALAAACAAAGIAFVGPPPAAIEAMGDKIRAKETVAARGVRVVPGVSGVGLSDAELAEQANAIGFPVLIKPSAGGGGKGMRLVTSADMLAAAIASAKREAIGAFGDDTLLIERFVDRPRHIEVQVLADSHGNVVHLGERECSLQRRQKVIEEAPSPFLSPADRDAIGAQAVAAAVACGYVNAGTVEFIASGSRPDEPFFMEMNTRLQVEHPVTEAVWGLDLVELQLRIADGKHLPFTQADLRPAGHAFEARVYAEDVARGFLPTGGRVIALHEPADRPNVRVDSSLSVGTEIGSNYDPMLSNAHCVGSRPRRRSSHPRRRPRVDERARSHHEHRLPPHDPGRSGRRRWQHGHGTGRAHRRGRACARHANLGLGCGNTGVDVRRPAGRPQRCRMARPPRVAAGRAGVGALDRQHGRWSCRRAGCSRNARGVRSARRRTGNPGLVLAERGPVATRP